MNTTLNTIDIVETTVGKRGCYATHSQIEVLNILSELNKGGFATVHGYKPKTNYIVRPIVNINFISKFSIIKLYERKLKALQNIDFSDLILTESKIVSLSLNDQKELFENCRAGMIDSLNKTINGDRSDNYRKAHDLFYETDSLGIKVHFLTEKISKETHLILHNDLPVVDKIMINVIEIGRKIIQEGEKKVINSGPKVLMDKAINHALRNIVINMFTLSLDNDNFDYLSIGGEIIDSNKLEEIQQLI